MTKLPRNRTFTLMFAILAFMVFTFGLDAWCPMQEQAVATQAAATCHPMPPDAASSQSKRPHSGNRHGCCKVCVCHLGPSALPANDTAPPVPATARYLAHRSVRAVASGRVFSHKSTPRGPPVQL